MPGMTFEYVVQDAAPGSKIVPVSFTAASPLNRSALNFASATPSVSATPASQPEPRNVRSRMVVDPPCWSQNSILSPVWRFAHGLQLLISAGAGWL